MTTKTWKVYGRDGHRQALSFGRSVEHDFSNEANGVRKIELVCADKTGTNEFVIVKITRNTAQECVDELEGQLSDGLFENYRYGRIEEIEDIEEGKPMAVTRYDYNDLRAAAESGNRADLDRLGEWLSMYGADSWNGEYYDADGLELFPLYEYRPECPGQLFIIGYTTDRAEVAEATRRCIVAGYEG